MKQTLPPGNQNLFRRLCMILLGRPLKYLIVSLMALIRDPMYEYFSKGFSGQPSILNIGLEVYKQEIHLAPTSVDMIYTTLCYLELEA